MAITNITPGTFRMDQNDIVVAGSGFGATPGKLVIADSTNRYTGSQVDISNSVVSWSTSQVKADLGLLSAATLSSLQTLGPGSDRHIHVVPSFDFFLDSTLFNLWLPTADNITLEGTNTHITAISDPYGSHGVNWLGPATATNGPVWVPNDAHFNGHASLLVNFGVGQFKLTGDDVGSAWNGLHDYANNDSHVFIVVRYLTESGNLRMRLGNGDPANGSRIGWSFTDGSSGTTVTSLIRHNTTDASQNMTAGSAGLIGNTRVIRCSNYANLQEIEISGVGTSSEALVSPTQPVENSWNSFVLWTGGSSNWKLAAVATYVGTLTASKISSIMAEAIDVYGAAA